MSIKFVALAALFPGLPHQQDAFLPPRVLAFAGIARRLGQVAIAP
ncbi:hypothetical protein P8H27_08885 [Pseudomonas sp. sp1636]|nr:hypothetical protein [Pseudomonas sp. sp1636]MDM8349016.1 hypothetical protein [Pseudomonas sp. sp1636]